MARRAFPLHLHSIAWYAALVWVVSLLFGRVCASRLTAGIAAFIYAVSPTHAVPVFFLANRNALIGACFTAVAVRLHHEWRAHASWRAGAAAPLALACGLLANEGAVAAGAYLLAYALFLDGAPVGARLASLLPSCAVVAFTFDAPLDDPSIAWFGRLEPASSHPLPASGQYPPWTPPAVGRTVSAQ